MLTTNQEKVDLGILKYGQPYKFTYTLHNSSAEPISVEKLILGCNSCTKASIFPKSIVPNSEGVIDVTFTPGSRGIQNKSINVSYKEDNSSKTMLLRFTAQVIG